MSVPLPAPEAVRALLVGDATAAALTDAALEELIGDAALIVGPCIEGYDCDRQIAIVKYATADLIAGAIKTKGAGTLTAKALGDASESYGGGGAEFGKSAFWQKALLLDTDGCLALLGKPRALFEKV